MSDLVKTLRKEEDLMNIEDIKERHEEFEHRTSNAPLYCWQVHQDRGELIKEVERLRNVLHEIVGTSYSREVIIDFVEEALEKGDE